MRAAALAVAILEDFVNAAADFFAEAIDVTRFEASATAAGRHRRQRRERRGFDRSPQNVAARTSKRRIPGAYPDSPPSAAEPYRRSRIIGSSVTT